jgi:hypothetical protein
MLCDYITSPFRALHEVRLKIVTLMFPILEYSLAVGLGTDADGCFPLSDLCMNLQCRILQNPF